MNKIYSTILLLCPALMLGEETPFNTAASNTTSAYVEGNLALLGGISHDADEIGQFGYDVEDGYENYGCSLQIGAGHNFTNIGLFGYSNLTKFFPGFFFYQRSPSSPAILNINTSMLGYGLEIRTLKIVRFKAGYGNYFGNVEVGDEISGYEDKWATDIEEGSGFHWSVGLIAEWKRNLMVTWEFTQHDYTLTPTETQTPAYVEDINISQWNLSFSLAYNFIAFE